VRDAHARIGNQLLQIARRALDRVDFVVQEINLSAAREFALERLAHECRIVGRDKRLDREPMLRRRGYDRQVAQAGHRHVQGSRNRRRRQGEKVDFRAQLLQRLLLAHAEAVFLVDDDEARVA
jgi:hypothetical protein